MVISMMEHSGGRFIKQMDLKSLIDGLSSAPNIPKLNYTVVFSTASNSFGTTSKLVRCSIVSLMKEAKELDVMVPPASA